MVTCSTESPLDKATWGNTTCQTQEHDIAEADAPAAYTATAQPGPATAYQEPPSLVNIENLVITKAMIHGTLRAGNHHHPHLQHHAAYVTHYAVYISDPGHDQYHPIRTYNTITWHRISSDGERHTLPCLQTTMQTYKTICHNCRVCASYVHDQAELTLAEGAPPNGDTYFYRSHRHKTHLGNIPCTYCVCLRAITTISLRAIHIGHS